MGCYNRGLCETAIFLICCSNLAMIPLGYSCQADYRGASLDKLIKSFGLCKKITMLKALLRLAAVPAHGNAFRPNGA